MVKTATTWRGPHGRRAARSAFPSGCGSILEDLTALAPIELANDDGSYPRAVIENIAEFAYYTEYADSPSPCGPTCGDGVCGGAEDCVGCPADCECPSTQSD